MKLQIFKLNRPLHPQHRISIKSVILIRHTQYLYFSSYHTKSVSMSICNKMTLFTFLNEFMCDFLHIVALQKDQLNKALQSLADIKANFA